MKTSKIYALLIALWYLPCLSIAQDVIAEKDFFTFNLGQPAPIPPYNVTSNDIGVGQSDKVQLVSGDTSCFQLKPNGEFNFIGSAACFGSHLLEYEYLQCSTQVCRATIKADIRRTLDCFFTNLEEFSSGSVDNKICVYACANSASYFFVSYNSSYTYNWSVIGGVLVPGADPAKIQVNWGAAGSGSVAVTITNSLGESGLLQVCVNINDGPIADFSAPDSACLNAKLTFTNNSLGGGEYS